MLLPCSSRQNVPGQHSNPFPLTMNTSALMLCATPHLSWAEVLQVTAHTNVHSQLTASHGDSVANHWELAMLEKLWVLYDLSRFPVAAVGSLQSWATDAMSAHG